MITDEANTETDESRETQPARRASHGSCGWSTELPTREGMYWYLPNHTEADRREGRREASFVVTVKKIDDRLYPTIGGKPQDMDEWQNGMWLRCV